MAHCYRIKIFYEDTDAIGMVYHANYVRYLDRGRSEWLSSIGFELQAMQQNGVLFAVRHMALDFIKPAVLSDDIEVVTHLTEVRKASFTCQQTIHLLPDQNKVLCRANVQLACIDKNLKPARLPMELVEEMKRG